MRRTTLREALPGLLSAEQEFGDGCQLHVGGSLVDLADFRIAPVRNALVPVITLGALEFGELLSGAVLTEQVFTIPGFGKLIVDAVFNRDYAVVQGVVLVTATIYILLNICADFAYFLVNPRLRA